MTNYERYRQLYGRKKYLNKWDMKVLNPDFVLIPVPVLAPFPVWKLLTSTVPPGPAQPNQTNSSRLLLSKRLRKPSRCEDIREEYPCLSSKAFFDFSCAGWGG